MLHRGDGEGRELEVLACSQHRENTEAVWLAVLSQPAMACKATATVLPSALRWQWLSQLKQSGKRSSRSRGRRREPARDIPREPCQPHPLPLGRACLREDSKLGICKNQGQQWIAFPEKDAGGSHFRHHQKCNFKYFLLMKADQRIKGSPLFGPWLLWLWHMVSKPYFYKSTSLKSSFRINSSPSFGTKTVWE